MLTLWFALAAAQPPASHTLRQWTFADGLPQSTVTELQQTLEGDLLVGTFAGLARFDGVSFSLLDHSHLASIRVTASASDPAGNVWVGFQDGSVAEVQGDTLYPLPLAPQLEDQVIRRLTVEAEGVWALSGSTLMRWAPSEGWSSHPEHVYDVAITADGTTWIATEAGLQLITPHGRELLPTPGVPKVLLAEGDHVYLSTTEGVFRTEGEAMEPVSLLLADHGRPERMAVDTRGCLWGAYDHTLVRLTCDPGEPARWTLPTYISSLYADLQGQLWVGTTTQGLWRLAEQPFRHDDIGATLPILEDAEGQVWVGGCRGLFQVHEGETQQIPFDEDAGCITALAAHEQTLYIGVGRSLAIMNTRTKEWSARRAPARVLTVHQQGRTLWVGTDGGGLLSWDLDTGASSLFTTAQGLPSNRILTLVTAPDGTLWAGTHRGVAHRTPGGTWHALTARDGLPRAAVRSVLHRADGSVWFGTYGGGLVRWRRGETTVFTTAQGLPENVVSVLLDDHRGYLWINGNKGVTRIPWEDLELVASGVMERVRAKRFITQEGNGGSPAGWASADQHSLYFPTIYGFVTFDLDRVQVNPIAPTPRILRATLDGRPAEGHLPPGTGRLEVDYTATLLGEPELARFQVRLLGLEDRWQNQGGRRDAVWAQLPPGEYTLQLRASNEDGVWSEAPAELHFTLGAAWYQHRLVKLDALLALLLITVIVHRLRTSSIEAHNAALEREIKAREVAEAQRRALQESLNEAQRLEAVGRLAGGVAHDFNNLLTALMGATSVLHEELSAEGRGELLECIHDIQACADRGAELTRHLLAIGRRQDLNLQLLDPCTQLRKLRPVLHHTLRDDITLVLSLPRGRTRVRTDPTQLDVAILNLVLNAAQAMPTGGTITLTVAQRGEEVDLQVRDTGTGIAAEHLPHIFEPFYTSRPDGTGLGLAGVHGFATQSGGRVEVETSPEGSTFHLWLPAAAGTLEPTPEPPRRAAPGQGHVLLCDDDPFVLKALGRLIKKGGYKVTTTTRPAEALELLDRGGVDLLITDVLMPEMNGPELAAEANRRRPELPVLFISGYTDRELTAVPGAQLLRKPFGREEVLSAVGQALAS